MPLLDPNTILLRTILDASWVKDGKPHWTAFVLNQNDGQNGGGLSLLFTREAVVETFENPIYGLIDVRVENALSASTDEWKLSIVPDNENHASLMGLPNKFTVPRGVENRAAGKRTLSDAAELMGVRLANVTVVNEYSPTPFSTQDILTR